MKSSILTILLAVVFSFVTISQSSSDIAKFKADIENNKKDARNQLGSYKYDGAKVTYFNYRKVEQIKEVEVYLFNNTDYKLSFNGNSIPGACKIEIYNNSKIESERTLLAEVDNLSGKEVQISSDDLNASYKKIYPNGARLKRVYVNYVIPEATSSTANDRGAAVLVIGYK